MEELIEEEEEGALTIFTRLRHSEEGRPLLAKDIERFSLPLLQSMKPEILCQVLSGRVVQRINMPEQ